MALSIARVRRPGILLLAIALTACGDDVPEGDAGFRDGGVADAHVELDAFTEHLDAAPDASSPYDAGPLGCLVPAVTGSDPTGQLEDALGTATVTITDPDACLRTYALDSTATRRAGGPASPRTITEREAAPSVRTGNDLFDGLHALAIDEARENAVGAVRDYAFDDGRPVPCGVDDGGCFETGRLWNYVWTRDTAYAVDLGLAAFDPARARGSLEFKLSERRGGGGMEIVQDTGTGGSWPVSSDRVAWALGAAELLPWLEEPARTELRVLALSALRGTLERDRRIVFDPTDGLYRGEQSFLDWREQTYPAWVAGNLVHIAMSKTLSTNVLHLRALEIAADLAQTEGDAASATRWRGWAIELRAAIRARFWLEDEGLFSTYVTTDLDPSAVRRFDLLGESLAILAGVADEAQADRILSTYPHLGPGAAPVVHPQQQDVRIYHNRAEWPFVTAYLLRAAREAAHDAAGDRAMHALMRGAALNLSNMENLETATGAPYVEDGTASGPVVNSERQLWSVAGYLAMVHHVIFGIETDDQGLHVRPWITAWMRQQLFANASELVLRNFVWRGHAIDVVVHFPDGDASGYVIDSLELDGVAIEGAITEADLGAHTRVDVRLVAGPAGETELTTIADPTAWQEVFGPRTPSITAVAGEGARVRLTLDHGGDVAAEVALSLYRDGVRIASGLPGTTATYLDEATDAATTTHCWSLEACFVATGTCSQHAAPKCWWGASNERIAVIGASSFVATGGDPITAHGRFHYQAWGDPGDRLEASGFTALVTADHLLQVEYGNGGPTDTGITSAVKRILVEDTATGAIVGDGVLVMPHMGGWDRWGESSFVRVRLEAGRSYRFVVRDDDDTVNMSAFQHFASYTAGAGGRDGAFARVNIAELRILRVGL